MKDAKLAVEKYNEQHSEKKLSFVSIIEGEFRPPAEYNMVIATTNDDDDGGAHPKKYRLEFYIVEDWMSKHEDKGCHIISFQQI